MACNSITADEMLPHVGEFGRFQVMQEIFLSLILVCVTFSHYIGYFALLDSPWQCVSNSTVCKLNGTVTADESSYKDRCNMTLHDWEYTQPKSFSMASQFDLHCQSTWTIQMAISSFYLGQFLGGSINGYLADRFGRKKVLFLSTAWNLLGNFLCAFSPNIWFLICIRFFLGCSVQGGLLQAFILLCEMVGPNYRPMASSIYWQFWNISNSILTLTAYYASNWKLLFILCSAPYVFVLGFFPFIPESIRWLQTHGKKDIAMKIMKRVAKFNGRAIPEGVELHEINFSVTGKKKSLLDLFKSTNKAKKILILSYGWIAGNMLYHGLALASGGFGGNVYLNFLLVSLMEIPAAILYGVLVKCIGRKKTTVYSCFLASLACLSFIFIPINNEWKTLRLVFGMLGKLFVSIKYNTMFLWSAELYPTNIRATATAFVQCMAPLGSFAAPWISRYLKEVYPSVQFATFGAVALLSGILLLLLPETKDQPTAEVDET